MKYAVKNAAVDNDTLDVYIYSDIVDDVTASIYDKMDVKLISASKIQKMLDEKKDAKQINLYINSSGGDVMDGVAIYSQLKRHKAHVTAYIDGWACSIASVIPMAADKVVMSDASMLMIHHPWTVAAGNSEEFRKVADTLDAILEGSIIPAYKSKCGDKISDSELRNYLKDEKMLTAKQCLQYGFCDEIMENKSAESEAKEAVEEAKNQAMISFRNRMHEMYSNLKMPSGLPAAETVENAAETQQKVKNAAETQQEETHDNVSDVTDNNIGNIETESEPDKAEITPQPVEDKVNKNDYFLKLLKGEL